MHNHVRKLRIPSCTHCNLHFCILSAGGKRLMLLGVKKEVIESYNFAQPINIDDFAVDFEMSGEVLHLDLYALKDMFDLHTWESMRRKGNLRFTNTVESRFEVP